METSDKASSNSQKCYIVKTRVFSSERTNASLSSCLNSVAGSRTAMSKEQILQQERPCRGCARS